MTYPTDIRLGHRRSLLGEEVLYDGRQGRDSFLTEEPGRYVGWVPVCQEVEAGLVSHREAILRFHVWIFMTDERSVGWQLSYEA